jgi:glucose-1-phosphate thymidylyltransferase
MLVVGVIPAAGHATRLQPLQGSKEIVIVDGRPLIDHLVERLRLAPCDEIRVVARPEKEDLLAHVREVGLVPVLAYPGDVTESLRAAVEGLADDDRVCFGFPDTIWQPLDGFARLLSRLEGGVELVLGLFRGADLSRCDVVTLRGEKVVAVDVKPSRPGSPWIWGCAAATTRLLRELDDPEPGVSFDRLCREEPGRIAGIPLADEFADLGTREAFDAYLSRQ